MVPLRPTTNEDVPQYIRQLVFEGALRPGDRLPQDEIAEVLGVSRLPVREAVISLEHQGLLVVQPHRGAFVNRFDEELVRDHFDLHGVLHAHGTRRAAERGDPEVLENLTALQRAMAKTEDPEDFESLADQFHRTINLASGSYRLRSILRTSLRIVPGNIFLIPGVAEATRQEAAKIVSAMRKGDPARAAEAAQALLYKHGELVVAYLKGRGVFE